MCRFACFPSFCMSIWVKMFLCVCIWPTVYGNLQVKLCMCKFFYLCVFTCVCNVDLCGPISAHMSVCVSVHVKVWMDVNPPGSRSVTEQSSAQVSSRSCWVRANGLMKTTMSVICIWHEHTVWVESGAQLRCSTDSVPSRDFSSTTLFLFVDWQFWYD